MMPRGPIGPLSPSPAPMDQMLLPPELVKVPGKTKPSKSSAMKPRTKKKTAPPPKRRR